jgi:hypothetical protein
LVIEQVEDLATETEEAPRVTMKATATMVAVSSRQ